MILLKTTFLGVLIFADTSAASPVAQVTLRALFCSSSHGWFSTQSATAVQTRCPNVDVDTWTIAHDVRSRGVVKSARALSARVDTLHIAFALSG